MRLIHTGDIHIGSALALLPQEKAKLRQTEILDGFRRLSVFARENAVAAVLIAGDLLDTNKTPRYIKKEVFSIIESAKPVCFFYVSGNHDSEFDETDDLPENLYTFGEYHAFKSYDLPENITVTGMDTKDFSSQNFASLSLRPERNNVVLLHGDIYATASTVVSEQGLQNVKSKEGIPLGLLKDKHINYLALGHIHKPDAVALPLDSRGKYRYCGCLEGRGFDEIGPRGFFLLEVNEKGIVSEKFLSIATRETVEVCVDITGIDSYLQMEEAAKTALKSVDSKNAVKIVLCGSFSPSLKKDTSLLAARLAPLAFFVKVEDCSRLALDIQSYKNERSECGEFVREVGRYSLTERDREEILEVGLKALLGEEIDI